MLDLEALFGNSNPLEVDLGCGKGAFLAGEAARRREVNFIGVDRLTRKLDRASRRIRRLDLSNVRLFCADLFHFIENDLPPRSVSVFHLYFPDPWPKKRHHKRRTLTRLFVKSLAGILCPGGKVYLSTDSLEYHAEIMELFRSFPRFRSLEKDRSPSPLLTDFEEEFVQRNLPIYRAAFGFDPAEIRITGPREEETPSRCRTPPGPGS